MTTSIWVSIGSDNGLLPEDSKPLPEPMLTTHLLKSTDIHLRAVSQEVLPPSITKFSLKITFLKFHSNLPGSNELNNLSLHQRFQDQLICIMKNSSHFPTDVCVHCKCLYFSYITQGKPRKHCQAKMSSEQLYASKYVKFETVWFNTILWYLTYYLIR